MAPSIGLARFDHTLVKGGKPSHETAHIFSTIIPKFALATQTSKNCSKNMVSQYCYHRQKKIIRSKLFRKMTTVHHSTNNDHTHKKKLIENIANKKTWSSK